MDRSILASWPSPLRPFAAAMGAFAEGRLSGIEFETLFLAHRRAMLDELGGDVWEPLDRVFSAVDAFCGDPALWEPGDLGEAELREVVRAALPAVDEHVRDGRLALTPAPRRVTLGDIVMLTFQDALLDLVAPELRAVLVAWTPDEIRARFLYDTVDVGADSDAFLLAMEVETYVAANFPDRPVTRFTVESWPAPLTCMARGDERCAYLRHEAGRGEENAG